MQVYSAELLKNVHQDLTNRAKSGIGLYLVAWLLTTLPYQYPAKHSWFFYSNVAIISVIIISRLLHLAVQIYKPNFSVSKLDLWLVSSILLAGLHWGLVTLWSLFHGVHADISLFLVISASVFGIAGTISLSISNSIRRLYPIVVFTPLIVGLLYSGSLNNLILAAMAGIAMAYALSASKNTSRDYWRAITNHSIAEQRAVQMEKLSVTDQLTQLKNRSYFDQRLTDEWKRGNRQQTLLSLLMLDLDHFKRVNDTYGHVAGDYCLVQVGKALQSAVQRETDLVARYGGEEFVILLPNSDEVTAESIAESLRLSIANLELEYDGEKISMSCSIGGATVIPDHSNRSDVLIQYADKALYLAKRSGRNQYQKSVSSVI